MAIESKAFDNLTVNAFISKESHRGDDSTGYMTSARRASAANASAARIASSLSRGCASRICSTVSPAANFSRINSTVMRVPAITGLPIITSGLETIISTQPCRRRCRRASSDHDEFLLGVGRQGTQGFLASVLQDERNRLAKIRQAFFTRLTLAVGSAHFGAIRDVPWAVLLDNRRELIVHASILLPPYELVGQVTTSLMTDPDTSVSRIFLPLCGYVSFS